MERLRWYHMLLGLLCATMGIGCGTTDPDTDARVTIRELQIGSGALAENNKVVTVHYTGALALTGDVFDTTLRPGREPLSFELETGLVVGDSQGRTVIDGFVQGIPGMRVGGIRSITVPPQLAWGSRGAGCNNPSDANDCTIPPNSVLLFEIELLDVQDAN